LARLFFGVRTMSAIVLAAKPSLQKKAGGKDHQVVFEIIIAAFNEL
jgi:hypothetical protein